MINERIDNINYNIEQLEIILDSIFDDFNNFNFENIPCAAYIFKDKIRFVPLILKQKIDSIFTILNMTSESKNNILSRKR